MQIAVSILAADFAALGRDIAAAERGGADLIHVDVMDGHFVPNITIGLAVARASKRIADSPARRPPDDRGTGPLHRGVRQGGREHDLRARGGGAASASHHWPDQELGARAGASSTRPPRRTLIEDCGRRRGFRARHVRQSRLQRTDVHSAQHREAARVRAVLDAAGSSAPIEIDGGIDASNAADVVAAGADILVAGNAVFGGGDPEAATRALRQAVVGAGLVR
jgi:ribulose-phosphate 3-epimerase